MRLPNSADAWTFVRGLLMGAADIVPGVSGGTVALIVGIYERLVTAISRFDGRLVKLLGERDWAAAAERVDLRFLVALGAGIATGIASLAKLMHYLLEHERSYTYAAFFGLILASALLVGKLVKPASCSRATACWALGALGGAFAFWLVRQESSQASDVLGYYFFCGLIAICAMILPGISGSFILLILGVYETVITIIKNATHLEFTGGDLAKLGVFAAGCAIGLISFAKLLRWLLVHFHDLTMAVLCGFMIGSLWKIWPFQTDLTPEIEKFSRKRFENYWPETWSQEATTCLVIGVVAFFGVLAIERFAAGGESTNATTNSTANRDDSTPR